MNRLSSILALLCLTMSLWLTSCKPGVPGEFIQPGKMEAILYDYHLAQAMLANSQNDNTPENQQLYKLAVLQKHGVTEAQYEASMAYYMRHADRMHDIYEKLATRFERSAMEHGITVSELNQYGTGMAKGDTADVWNGERSMMLTNHAPFHLRTFTLKTDTTYRAGDKLMLNFDAQYIVQEGSREGIAVLAVRFANDSVASQMQRVSSNSHYTLQIEDSRRLGIKSISGYFLLNKPLTEHSSTLKLFSLTHIQLVRMHTREQKPEEKTEKADSADVDSAAKNRPMSDRERRRPNIGMGMSLRR